MAAGACELIVVRHGETEWNRLGKQQGHLDSPLTEAGRKQAERIAERLSGEEFAALYSSDLGRAYHTAEAVGERTGHEVVVEARFKERNLGIFQGLTMREVEARYREEYALFRVGDADYRIPQGESIRERYERSVAAAEEVAARHAGERVVVVTHGGILDSFFRRAVGMDLGAARSFKLFNASINMFFVEEGHWVLGTWGDISHLAGIGSMDDW